MAPLRGRIAFALVVLGACCLGLPQRARALAFPQLGMGSGNLGNDQTNAMMDCRINSLLNFNAPSTRLTTTSFFNGSTPSPQTMDWVVQKASAAGLHGILLFDYYLNQGPMATYSQWYAIGAAYAARFRPNSPWMTANTANPALGITLYEAFNEPDNTAFGPQIPIAQYHAGLKGLADGIHSVDPTLKVFPGGYSRPNAQSDYTCGGYCTAITDLLNDGTLAGIDLHTYFGFWTPVSNWNTSSQHNFDAVKSVCGITRDIDLCVTESGYGVTGAEGGSTPTAISEATSAGYNLTVLWDGMGVVGNAGQSVVQVSHTFALVLEDPTSAQPDLAFTTTQCPWVPNPRGQMIQLVANLTQGMSFISLLPKSRGEYILIGSGGSRKKMWVWQDRTNWTNIGGTSYNVTGIPAGSTSLQVYNAAGLMSNITLTGQSSYNVTGLPVANTYMFVASGIPGTPTQTPTASPSPTVSPTATITPIVACPSRMNFEAPATVGNWTTLNQGLPPASLTIDATQADCGAQSLKATGSVSAAQGEWVFNVFSSPQDLSAQGQVFEAWVKLSPAFPGGSIGIISQDGIHTQAAGWVAMTGQTGWVHIVADYSGYTAAQWNKANVTSVGIVLNTSANWTGTVNVDEFDWHVSGTATPSPTITRTRTASPTPSLSPTASATPTLGASPSPSLTATLTPVVTPSLTPSVTTTSDPSATLTATLTPTATPSQTMSSTPGAALTSTPVPGRRHGRPKPLAVVPVPNPQSGSVLHLAVKMEADADALQVRLYSKAMALVAIHQLPGSLHAGWNQVAVPLSQIPSAGIYFLVLTGISDEGREAQSVPSKVVFL